MLDADGLKKINDELGHEAGDAYLKSISEILISFNSPNCISARYGGDEFILFIHNLENDSQVDAYLQKLADIRRETKAEVAPDKIHLAPLSSRILWNLPPSLKMLMKKCTAISAGVNSRCNPLGFSFTDFYTSLLIILLYVQSPVFQIQDNPYGKNYLLYPK